MAAGGLELHPEKTRIVYCKDDDRPGRAKHTQFDFLGYTFRPRRARNYRGKYCVSFLPAVRNQAAKAIRATIRGWRMPATPNNQSLEKIARLVNPSVRGWMNDYGRFYRSQIIQELKYPGRTLIRWVCRKYRRFRRRKRAASYWLGRIACREPKLFAHWQLGLTPAVGR